MGNVTRAEWRWAIIASLLIIAISSIPYLTGYLAQTPDKIFGGAVFDRMDYNVHLASIHTGLRGGWQYAMLHTSENVAPVYVKTFYIALGQAGRLLPLSPRALYEAARWACGLWMLVTLYAFASRFVISIPLRRIAFLIGALGSGLGWFMLAIHWLPDPNVSPIDFWITDLYGFLSLLVFPHFSAVFALTWTAVILFLDHLQTNQLKHFVLCMLALFVAQMAQPFVPFIADVVLGCYVVWRWFVARKIFWRDAVSLGVLGASQLPLTLYSSFIISNDPIWRSFSDQNQTISPAPIYYVMGVGLMGGLALWGGWRLARRRRGESDLLMIWLLAVMILIYAPTQLQRRFTEAAIAPIAVLASIGLGRGLFPVVRRLYQPLASYYPYRRARNLLAMLAIMIVSLSSLYLVFGTALIVSAREKQYFDSVDVVNAVDWLGANSDWGATVLSSERTGGLIPARIGHRVYLGHPIETANYRVKVDQVEKFYSTMSDEERKTLLAQCDCRFVFYSLHERELGPFNPDTANYLKRVYASNDVKVYEVVR